MADLSVWDAVEAMNERRAAALDCEPGDDPGEFVDSAFIRRQLSGLDLSYEEVERMARNIAGSAEDQWMNHPLPDDLQERADAHPSMSEEDVRRVFMAKTIAADMFIAGVYYERARSGKLGVR